MSNSKLKKMYATYDPVSGCGYIYLDGKIKSGGVKSTMIGPNGIHLDFDHDGRLVGIELLDGKAHLPRGLCATADLYEEPGDE